MTTKTLQVLFIPTVGPPAISVFGRKRTVPSGEQAGH
jgi:hypothetical protein